ncbi:MAG: AAA family ATPase [Prevotellaceae bacterium]|jgi:AAA15 family ATPase/GTPase|nr:AAA family ATPase [Prevotellaceae bacterium]
MENLIKYVNIHNFKSIADLELEDCRRINLFIGYPNVGKSNVLEALSLFSVPFLQEGESLNKFIRVQNQNELFHDINLGSCKVFTNLGFANFYEDNVLILGNKSEGDSLKMRFSNDMQVEKNLNSFLHLQKWGDVKKYTFALGEKLQSYLKPSFLLPPFGENIIDTLSHNTNVVEMKAWMQQEFAKFGLEYVLDKISNHLKVQRRLNRDEIVQLPYSSIADTLQRMIFYKTAIASNKNSVLLFEEPEAHAFPPYIATIMNDIVDAESNQFFIVTHSPIVVNAFLEYEKVRSETSIYLFDFKNEQTTAKRLSDEEMELAYEYGDDLFFNLENLL